MEIKRRYLRKVLENEQKSEVKYALEQIELDIFEPLQEMDLKHLVPFTTVIKDAKSFSEVDQKRFRKGKVYCYSNSINQLSMVNHVILNLSTFKEKNISLSIFETRALFHLLKRKFDCEVIRISDLNLIHFRA
jgi:glutamate mutase epsilon subunit